MEGKKQTKMNRLEAKLARLEQEAKQARARLKEEAAQREKAQRYAIKYQIEREQRLLGLASWVGGMNHLKKDSIDGNGDPIKVLNLELIAGAVALLYEQLKSITDEAEIDRLKNRGRELIEAYNNDERNPRLRMPEVGMVQKIKNKGEC
jgi:hypothetical protein